MMASRYAHAKQLKRHHRQLRLLRSRLGRIICDIRRQFTDGPSSRRSSKRRSRALRRSNRNSSASVDGSSIPSTPPRSNASSMKGCGSPGCQRARSCFGSCEKFSSRADALALPQRRTLQAGSRALQDASRSPRLRGPLAQHTCHAQIARRANMSQARACAVGQIKHSRASRLDEEGRSRSSRTWAGCDGRGGVRQTWPRRTVKPCGPGAPKQALSSWD